MQYRCSRLFAYIILEECITEFYFTGAIEQFCLLLTAFIEHPALTQFQIISALKAISHDAASEYVISPYQMANDDEVKHYIPGRFHRVIILLY